ncbi:MAG: PEP-CTERM sorting domain-containing protein [Phycisphaerales bacterium]|nr:MAG: PEP-CTERM sorting domain-containing protein [Phycisphaerales bacterium]
MCQSLFATVLPLVFLSSFTEGDSDAPMFVVDSSKHLLTVDVTTGEVSLVGNMGVQLTDVAFGHNGRLFGVNARFLYEIDPSNGDTTFIGNHGYGESGSSIGIDALTFGDDGILYGAGDDVLISIDPATGAGTTVGTLSGHRSSGDLAADASGRLLLTTDLGYLVEAHRDGSGATLIGSIPNVDVYAFAGNGDGELFGIRSTGGIVSINGSTGYGSEVGSLQADFPLGAIWGGSFYDQYLPEPATLMLAAFGAVFCLRRGRRASAHR